MTEIALCAPPPSQLNHEKGHLPKQRHTQEQHQQQLRKQNEVHSKTNRDNEVVKSDFQIVKSFEETQLIFKYRSKTIFCPCMYDIMLNLLILKQPRF